MLGEKKQKQAIVKLITIIPIIICLVVIIFLIIAVFSKGKITQPEIQPANEKNQGENQTETSPAQNLGVENKTAAENQTDIENEKIKMDIITGKREDVPPELAAQIGEDKQLIIAQYLYDCYMISDINQRAACYDVYYMNNDANYKQQKESCEKLNNQEFTNCMDSLYYNASAYLGANLCPAIKDDNLRENCLTSIK